MLIFGPKMAYFGNNKFYLTHFYCLLSGIILEKQLTHLKILGSEIQNHLFIHSLKPAHPVKSLKNLTSRFREKLESVFVQETFRR